MPMKNWLNNEWNPLMHELLGASNLARDGFFDGLWMRVPVTVHRPEDDNLNDQTRHDGGVWNRAELAAANAVVEIATGTILEASPAMGSEEPASYPPNLRDCDNELLRISVELSYAKAFLRD